MSTTLERPIPTPVLPPGSCARLDRVSAALWRVVDGGSNLVVGHLAALPGPAGMRYRAQRFHATTGGFRPIGEFWSASEAAEALRTFR